MFHATCSRMVTRRAGLSGSQGRARRAVMTCSPRGAVTCRYPPAAPPETHGWIERPLAASLRFARLLRGGPGARRIQWRDRWQWEAR